MISIFSIHVPATSGKKWVHQSLYLHFFEIIKMGEYFIVRNGIEVSFEKMRNHTFIFIRKRKQKKQLIEK